MKKSVYAFGTESWVFTDSKTCYQFGNGNFEPEKHTFDREIENVWCFSKNIFIKDSNLNSFNAQKMVGYIQKE